MMTDRVTTDALSAALENEYRAHATYRKEIEAFGPVCPFVEAENWRVTALLRGFGRIAVPPPDTWRERAQVPDTLAEVCARAVQAEVENEALYSRLLGRATRPATRSVMLRLQKASRERHLPLFRRCSAHAGPRVSATSAKGALQWRYRAKANRFHRG